MVTFHQSHRCWRLQRKNSQVFTLTGKSYLIRPNDNDPGAYIKIKSRKIKNPRFAPHSYEKQLKKLKYLFSEPKFYQSETIERIDLSHDRSVFAKII